MQIYPINALLAAVFVLLCSSIAYVLHKNRKLALAINLITLASLAMLSLYLLESGAEQQIFGFLMVYPFSTFMLSITAILFALVNLAAYGFGSDRFFALSGFVLVGAFAVISSTSFLSLLIGIELIAIPASFMIPSKEPHTTEATIKFFIMSSAAAASLAFGIALIYPFNVSLLLSGWLGSNIGISYIPLVSFMLILLGLSFECALLPFNLWMADVYQGSQGAMPAMLSGINMFAMFAALIEVYVLSFGASNAVTSKVLAVVAAATMLFGNLLALRQKNVKRMLAYSSIVQAGYIAVGISAYPIYGIGPAIFYMVAYAFAAIGVFVMVSHIDRKGLRSMEDYSGLSATSPVAAFALAILMLSMVGIPPLAGFVAKFATFSAAAKSSLVWLAVFAVLNSFISMYYYGRLIMEMYSSSRPRERIAFPWGITAAFLLCVAVIVALGIYPQPVLSASYLAANSIVRASVLVHP
jgi:NADH-quinone oxidoreductase subunit N